VVGERLGRDAEGAWYSRETSGRRAVQRAGTRARGRSSALAIWRREQTHCVRVEGGRASAASIRGMASAKEGSRRGREEMEWCIGIGLTGLVVAGDGSALIMMYIGISSSVYWVSIQQCTFLTLRILSV
jgi:streptomycin 6-kinase